TAPRTNVASAATMTARTFTLAVGMRAPLVDAVGPAKLTSAGAFARRAGRAHAAQPLHALVPLAVVPEVQLRTGEKFGLVGGARILGEVIEREAVHEATQGEIVQLAGFERRDRRGHERQHLLRLGGAGVGPSDRNGLVDERRKGGVR